MARVSSCRWRTETQHAGGNEQKADARGEER
jgi:hypothetical protein